MAQTMHTFLPLETQLLSDDQTLLSAVVLGNLIIHPFIKPGRLGWLSAGLHSPMLQEVGHS